MREDMQHIETRGIDKRTCVCLTALPPLPSHTLIPLRTTSISWTRRRRHSTRPAPYMSKADICETSKGTKEIIEMLRKSLLLVNTSNCLIQNLSEMESLPHLKIYSNSSQLSPGVFNTGGENGVNDEREEFGSKGCCIEVSERR